MKTTPARGFNRLYWVEPPVLGPPGVARSGVPTEYLRARRRGILADYWLKAPRCGGKTMSGGVCRWPVAKHGDRCFHHGGRRVPQKLKRHPDRDAVNRLHAIWRRGGAWMWHTGSTVQLAEQDEQRVQQIAVALWGRGSVPFALADWCRWQYASLVTAKRLTRMARQHGVSVGEGGFVQLLKIEGQRRLTVAGPRPSQAELDQLDELESLLHLTGRRWRRRVPADEQIARLRGLARPEV